MPVEHGMVKEQLGRLREKFLAGDSSLWEGGLAEDRPNFCRRKIGTDLSIGKRADEVGNLVHDQMACVSKLLRGHLQWDGPPSDSLRVRHAAPDRIPVIGLRTACPAVLGGSSVEQPGRPGVSEDSHRWAPLTATLRTECRRHSCGPVGPVGPSRRFAPPRPYPPNAGGPQARPGLLEAS
jgi:hypothetical protein